IGLNMLSSAVVADAITINLPLAHLSGCLMILWIVLSYPIYWCLLGHGCCIEWRLASSASMHLINRSLLGSAITAFFSSDAGGFHLGFLVLNLGSGWA
ncbi:hypothetical protein B0H13DRAFT_2127295, partial [Mycena leptocephala]